MSKEIIKKHVIPLKWSNFLICVKFKSIFLPFQLVTQLLISCRFSRTLHKRGEYEISGNLSGHEEGGGDFHARQGLQSLHASGFLGKPLSISHGFACRFARLLKQTQKLIRHQNLIMMICHYSYCCDRTFNQLIDMNVGSWRSKHE